MEQSKRYIYIRCSTEHQDYMQQLHTIHEHFASVGISQDAISAIYSEKASGTVKHTERKLSLLLDTCKRGDYIYISELSRLGRSMSDLFAIVAKASDVGKDEAERIDVEKERKLGRKLLDHEKEKYGVTIIQCKDGSAIENNSISGKALLFALGLAAEIEVANIRQRTRSSIDAIRAKIARGEEHISKSGNVCTHLGREKGCDTSKATTASVISKQARAENWRRNSVGYNAVIRWIREGRDTDFILHEFNANHASNPKDYSTPKGCELTENTLKQWRREIKNMILI